MAYASCSRALRLALNIGKIKATETRKRRTEAADAMPGRLERISALKI
jgi:hypothetical protein